MASIRHAVIMAAGRGTRMLPLTKVLPKAMLPVEETTLIVKGINGIKKQIDNMHITVGYKGAMLAQHVIENNVSSVINTEGKGNAWWIFNSLLSKLNEPTFVLTCDNILELNFKLLEEDYFLHKSPACMVVPVKPIAGLEGDYIFHNNDVIYKLSREEKSEQYCSGIQIIHPAKINSICGNLNDFDEVWKKLIAKKELYCSRVYPEKWFAIDTIETLQKLNKDQEKTE